MLSRLTLLSRLGLVCALVVPAVIAAPILTSTAVADDDDDDDDFDDDDDDGGGGDDDDDDDDDDEDKSQPPVTAGGMFTKKNYPINAIERTLLVIGGMLEVRAGMDIDVSDTTAFDIWNFRFDGRYGLRDNVELQFDGGFLLVGDRAPTDPVGNFGAAIEAGVYFETVNLRAGFNLPFIQGDTEDELGVGFDIILGVPFRYRYKDKVAILALDKILTIHTREVIKDSGLTPDLTVGVAGVIQLAKQVAAILRAEVTLVQFDSNNVVIPATAAIQFSPNNKFDLGLEFTFKDLKVDEDQEGVPEEMQKKFYDDRSVLLFGQARF